jgi:hypothetical protein
MSPSIGRFVSPDPFEGFLTEPTTLLNYIYASSNPTLYVDPSGLLSLKGQLIVSAVIGGLTNVAIEVATTSEISAESIAVAAVSGAFEAAALQFGFYGLGRLFKFAITAGHNLKRTKDVARLGKEIASVESRIQPLGNAVSSASFPEAFILHSRAGAVFVNWNGAKHFGELFSKTLSTTFTPSVFQTRLAQGLFLDSFEKAVAKALTHYVDEISLALEVPIKGGQLASRGVIIDGWELTFTISKDLGAPGVLPLVVKHARYIGP